MAQSRIVFMGVIIMAICLSGICCHKKVSAKAHSHAELPQRIVVAGGPLYAEMLLDLEATSKIVGICQSRNTPKQLSSLPSVGTSLQPSVEKMLSLKPDLVVGVYGQTKLRLEQMGVATFLAGAPPYGEIRCMDDIFASIRALDKKVYGSDQRSQQLIAKIKQQIQQLQEQPLSTSYHQVAVVFFSGSQSPFVQGKDSIAQEILQKLALSNVFGDLNSSQVSLEIFIARNPEIILTDPSQKQLIMRHPQLQTLQAVKENQVYPIPASYWTSSRLVRVLSLIHDHLSK